MKPAALGGLLNKKAKVYYLGVLVILILLTLLGYWHWHKPSTQQSGSFDTFINAENKTARQALDNKDYSAALDSYIKAATAAMTDNNPQAAKKIYINATTNIPDKYIDWSVYDSLYVIAVSLHDKTLQISSLQKALAKAQQPNSGAGINTINFYKSQLKKLGAK